MNIYTVIKISLLIFVMFLLTVYNVNAAVLNVTGEVNYKDAWEVLDFVNEYRIAEGLPPLIMDSVLMEAAMQRAAECSVVYSHTRPNGTECFSLIEVRKNAAENAAMDFDTPAEVVDAWMNSEGHKLNIISDNFTSIGIGVFYIDGTKYWTQFFDSGEPRSVTKSSEIKKASYTIEVNDLLLQMNTIQTETITFHGDSPFDGESIKISGMYTNNKDKKTFVDNSKLLFVSSNPKIVTIDSDGIITPILAGNAVISINLKSDNNVIVRYNVSITEHIYSDWEIRKQADCNNNGTMQSSCKICGKLKTQTIPATGKHDYSLTSITKQPSCYATGIQSHQCTNPQCNKYYTTEIPATKNHKYNDGIVTKLPTTTNTGIKIYSCTTPGCNESYTTKIPVLPPETTTIFVNITTTLAVIPETIIAPIVDTVTERLIETIMESITEPITESIVEPVTVTSTELIEMEKPDIPLASPLEVMEEIPIDENETDVKISISVKAIPFVILLIIIENIILILIIKKENR